MKSLHLSVFFKGGDKRTTNLVANRDINSYTIINNNSLNSSPDSIEAKAQKLISSQNSPSNTTLVVVGTFLGIVKSIEKPGTRVHLDFAVINKDNSPTVLQGTYIKFNDGVVHFKKFYKSNSNGSREPDMSKWFPIVINSQGAEKLEIEFENIDLELIHKGKNDGEIFVLAESNKLSSRKFILNVDDAMLATLKDSQESADKTEIPAIFQATIQSLE